MTRFQTSSNIISDAMPDEFDLAIVCAVWNGERVLGSLLDSYRPQASPRVQFLVIDAASTDATMAIVAKNRDIVQDCISEPDAGIYDAWNKAIARSSARFISFIGADDRIAPGAVQALLSAIDDGGANVDLIAGFNIMTHGAVPSRLIPSRFSVNALTWKMPLAQLMSAHSRRWLTEADGFDASYKSSGDYELLIRERARVKVMILPTILAYMEAGGTSGRGLRPYREDFRARVSNGMSHALAALVFAKAVTGYSLRAIGLKR